MYLVFDIGGTKTRIALSKDLESIGDPLLVETPQEFDEAIELFRQFVKNKGVSGNLLAAAGGIRRLSPEKDSLLADFRLPKWEGEPLRTRLEKITGSSVYLENDTAMVGLGEAVAGAGKGQSIVVYFTISTGVGGVRIVDEKVDDNTLGFEPGHQIVDIDWTKYPQIKDFAKENNLGQLEAYVSGTSVKKRLGKEPYEIEDEALWDELAQILSSGLTNTILHWSPDIVILGGGMMKSPGISVEKVNHYLQESLTVFPRLPKLVGARLGDFGGLYGSLSYLKKVV